NPGRVAPRSLDVGSRPEDRQDFRLESAGHVDRAGPVHEDVHLAPDAEIFEIEARLDREARPGEDQTLLVGLEIIHVGAVAVDFLADVVAGPMDEMIAVTGLVDDPSAGGVDLPSG